MFSRYQLTCYVKKVHWDCPWEVSDDSNLLKGIYEYGMGSWEAIKMDTDLKLHDKVKHYHHSPKYTVLRTWFDFQASHYDSKLSAMYVQFRACSIFSFGHTAALAPQHTKLCQVAEKSLKSILALFDALSPA